ncbi:tumor necrosis factor alpha-induced protein 2-like isoform X2 [Anabas testudineus]|nr:tumor necrosis factor alpha-induced protein 2-like isoform X2 [Anabas testudineus]
MRFPKLKILRSPRGQSPTEANNSATVVDGAQSVSSDEEPENVILTFEESLERLHLSQASQMLIQREERLFGEITEAEALKQHKEDVDKLAADYRKLKDIVESVIDQSMSVSIDGVGPDTLTSAVKAIYQEEEQDQRWRQRDQTPPAWRPCRWKADHDSKLSKMVKDRLDAPSTPPAELIDQSSLQQEINLIGRQLKDDLLWVVGVVRTCYPPQAHICNFYARLYHQFFSSRINKIANFGLVDKDCTFLLRWVNEYYPGILQSPDLAREIDTEAFGKLLPKELLEPLEEQYLSKQQSELKTYIGRVLDEAAQKWNNGEEPKREDGCYTSPVAYDIIQLINGMVTAAEKVLGDLTKAQSVTRELSVFIERFRSFQDNIIRQNREDSKAYIKANLGCIKQFREVLETKSSLFLEDERVKCLSVLDEMKQSAHMYLLNPVHDSLKQNYRKLGTNDWLNKSAFDKLLVSIETQIHDLQGSTESCHQELMCQFHEDVTVEYMRRLLKGEVKLKDRERQDQAYMLVKSNAERLHSLFSRMGSKEVWLKEILTKMAEVLKLQDLPAIQMQVVSLGSAFPDLSEKHISALLKLKTNFSKADRKTVKETLKDALRETTVENPRPFFSKVPVK